MTLGGLALAVGILVDDATVTIENINWHLEQGKATQQAILDGGQQIIIPALFSFLSISIVFVPMFYLQGVARYLFVPMAEAVVFALLGSFILSRTLVPVLAKYLLEGHEIGNVHGGESGDHSKSNVAVRLQQRFERGVADARRLYTQILRLAMGRRAVFIGGFLAFVVISVAALEPWLGENFFPSVDSGEIKLHVRAQPGTRIEETARLCDQIEGTIRRIIPPSQIDSIIDNIGLPISGINISYSNSAPIGAEDADVLIKLKGSHAPTDDYVKLLRERLPRMYPEATYAFLPADIVSQILNFGMPAPIDVQVVGFKRDENARYAQMLLSKLRHVAGIADLRMQQTFDQPVLNVKVDRIRANEVGLTQRDIANSMLVSLSGSAQVSPNFWVNPSNKVSYPPQYRLNTLSDLANIPVSGAAGSQPQLLGALATITQGRAEGVVSHYDVQPTMDLYATVQGRDLGAVTSDINAILQQTANQVPGGSTVVIRGQVQTMNQSYVGLLLGIAGAFVLIYLLLVVDFQSWRDPFIVICALPAALAGITWMLFVTGTTLSVPALTGAMMSMGVGTANSILVVSFAREQLALGRDPITAAIEAGATRFRPVLMTALAMIIGMIPMALAMGEGGEQNAPLGRAVIGGLLFATVATLIFVPVVFSLLHRHDAPAGDGAGAAPSLTPPASPDSTLSPI
jgi:multidrug efflux pump subunit AcrB